MYLIRHEQSRHSEPEDYSPVEYAVLRAASALFFIAGVASHFNAEVLRRAEILHSLKLKDGAGIRVGKGKAFRGRQRELFYSVVLLRQSQEHIGVKISHVAENTVGAVAAVFKICLVLGVSCGVKAVATAYQNYRKAVFARNPHYTLVTVYEPVLSLGELHFELSVTSHAHQLVVCTAEAAEYGISCYAFLRFFTFETAARRVYQIDLPVANGTLGVVLKICTECFHSFPLTQELF